MAIHETVYINLFLIFRYLSYLDGFDMCLQFYH